MISSGVLSVSAWVVAEEDSSVGLNGTLQSN